MSLSPYQSCFRVPDALNVSPLAFFFFPFVPLFLLNRIGFPTSALSTLYPQFKLPQSPNPFPWAGLSPPSSLTPQYPSHLPLNRETPGCSFECSGWGPSVPRCAAGPIFSLVFHGGLRRTFLTTAFFIHASPPPRLTYSFFIACVILPFLLYVTII